MSIGQQIRSGWGLLFHKDLMRKELGEELQGFEELLMSEKIAQGLTPDQARREARLEIGGRSLVEENVYETWLGSALDSLLQDVRFLLRTLAKSPGFAAGECQQFCVNAQSFPGR